MKHSTTIKDIAKYLGISVATVSRALSDQWDVSPQTRAKVLEVARLLNYQPNLSAQRLSQQQSHLIGLIVPELENSFFPRIIVGLQSILEEAGYLLLITNSNESSAIEEKNIRTLERNRVDGIILSVTQEGANKQIYEDIIAKGTPLVLFNRICDIDTPKVIIDDYKMSCLAVEHLIKQGCTRIAHIAGPEQLNITNSRKQGYIDTLTKYQIPIQNDYIIHAGIMQENGYEAMQQLLQAKPRPDAVFCVNDPVAIGAMKAIKHLGLRIPQDIALVGYSESRSACLVEPNLTSVAQPLFEIGKNVAELMLKKIEGKMKDNPTITLHAKLNIRESSCKTDLCNIESLRIIT